jgi:cytochrome c biogenesis protein CcdA
LLLAIAGSVAWNQGALAGLRWVEFDSSLTLAAFGFLAGLGAFFAPCAFSLFPGYISYYLAASTPNPDRERLSRSFRLGLTCAAGSTAFFALVGAVITMIGGAVSPYLIGTKPFIALGVVLLGVVLVADVRLPAVPVPFRSRGNPGGRLPRGTGVFLYGFGYALASTGCTLPIYVSAIVLPLTSGYSGAALLTFLSFALAMALMMLLTTALVGLAKRGLIAQLQGSTAWIKRGSGVVLILAGVYLGYYYVKAGM